MTTRDEDDKTNTHSGDWDNLEERGRRDRIWLSRTQYWEMSHFIRRYLEDTLSVNFSAPGHIQEAGRKILWEKVEKAIKEYPGRSPIKRTEMESHLDRLHAEGGLF